MRYFSAVFFYILFTSYFFISVLQEIHIKFHRQILQHSLKDGGGNL